MSSSSATCPARTIDVEVTFPDEYSANPDLEGKDAVFETTINYIEGEIITPDFNDEFVVENLQPLYGWNTVEEVTAQIEENAAETQISNYIWDYLRENSEVSEIPDVMFENEANTMLYQCESYAGMYGMTVEEYIESAFDLSSTDELIEEYRDQLETSCKDYLIALAIADEQNVEVTDDDIADYFAEGGVTDYSQYEETYGTPFLKFQVKIQDVNDLLRDNAVLL